MARVYYLAYATTPQSTQQILTALRTVVGIDKVFNFTGLSALAVRGTASDLAAAEWLIQSLDIPPDPKSVPPGLREHNMSDSVMQVSYAAPGASPTALRQTIPLLASKFDTLKASAFDTPPALILRGSPSQIAEAGLIIQAQNQTASAAK